MGRSEEIGPYVSEGCTYFVTHRRVPGLIYLPPQSPTIHPYVRRVIEDYQQGEHHKAKCYEHEFRETKKKNKCSSSSLQEFLRSPQSLSKVIEEFGYDWAEKDIAQECVVFGKEVWHTSQFKKEQDKQRRVNDRVNQMKVVVIGNCLPSPLGNIVEKTGLMLYEVLSLLQQMPVVCVSGTYKWDKSPD